MSKKRVLFLEQEILKHKNLYYRGKALISDFEYDKLEDELKTLDPKNPILELVGAEVFSTNKIEHEQKMLSLNKTYKIEDLLKWKGQEEIISTFKIDGSSCSLVYERGLLKLGKTRGDGRFGENITNKILNFPHIPKRLKLKEKIEIRGEVFCDEESFIKLSDEMEKLGLEKPSSLRNIVAGILGRKENIELSRFLHFQAFELISEDLYFKTEVEKLQQLMELGFETPEFFLNKSKKDIEERLSETKQFMSEGPYLIDGLVLTFNKIELHKELGETAHHPRYKMAFKFQGDTKTTKIKSISWQVSRNGFLTPVANVEPVDLSGASVARVTLHNYGMVKQHQLKAGDEIEIVRSGEVIPKFLEVIKPSSNKFTVPKVCPSCGEKVVAQEIRLVCINETCPDKIKDEILNFIKKIGIDDLSSKRLEELIKYKIVSDIPSLYLITKEQLLSLDKVKEKLADKLLATIEKSKKADLVTFLSALGLTGGAYNKCEKIVANGINTIDQVLKLKVNDLEQIESFAEKSATDLIDSLQSKIPMIKKLKSYGFSFTHNIAPIKESQISGQKFCITGTLTRKRSELQKMVKDNGGVVQSGVSANTDFLITNDVTSSSSKFKKAKELNIPIINEDTFLDLIK